MKPQLLDAPSGVNFKEERGSFLIKKIFCRKLCEVSCRLRALKYDRCAEGNLESQFLKLLFNRNPGFLFRKNDRVEKIAFLFLTSYVWPASLGMMHCRLSCSPFVVLAV